MGFTTNFFGGFTVQLFTIFPLMLLYKFQNIYINFIVTFISVIISIGFINIFLSEKFSLDNFWTILGFITGEIISYKLL